jgi:hypothetical protein
MKLDLKVRRFDNVKIIKQNTMQQIMLESKTAGISASRLKGIASEMISLPLC